MTSKIHNGNKHLLLKNAVEEWLADSKYTRQSVAMEVVEQFFELGLDRSLQIEDIFFMRTEDPFADAQANQQKLFRWLGILSDGQHRNLEKVFFLEPAIVAAMPEKIKLHYVTELGHGTGIRSSLQFRLTENGVDRVDIVSKLTRENAEAQVTLIQLSDNPTRAELMRARRELVESVSCGQAALEHIEAQLKEIETAQ